MVEEVRRWEDGETYRQTEEEPRHLEQEEVEEEDNDGGWCRTVPRLVVHQQGQRTCKKLI